jgi:hypothetical protein
MPIVAISNTGGRYLDFSPARELIFGKWYDTNTDDIDPPNRAGLDGIAPRA